MIESPQYEQRSLKNMPSDPILLSAKVDLAERAHELYVAFSAYTAPTALDASPLYDPAQILAALNSEPLTRLSTNALGPFATAALSMVGNAKDYKYFLPRILTLSTMSGAHEGFTPSVVARKLRQADWDDWPINEQSAVASFIYSAWAYDRLQSTDDRDQCWDWIAAMANLKLQFEACLHLWIVMPTPNAMLQLAEGAQEITSLHTGLGIWGDVAEIYRGKILQWLISPPVENALIEYIEAIDAAEHWKIERMLDEIDILRQLTVSM